MSGKRACPAEFAGTCTAVLSRQVCEGCPANGAAPQALLTGSAHSYQPVWLGALCVAMPCSNPGEHIASAARSMTRPRPVA